MAFTPGTGIDSGHNVVTPSNATGHGFQYHIPVIGNIHDKSPLAYKATRGVVGFANVAHMAFVEAYIHGVELPDSVLRSLFNTCMPIIFRYFPALMTPYEWVLKETDQLAEGSNDLMKIQYDLPQAMLNRMLGDGKLVYPKYSMGLWENGAASLDQSQIHMIDDMIEKLEIRDGENILDFGCGWGGGGQLHSVEVPQLPVHRTEPEPSAM